MNHSVVGGETSCILGGGYMGSHCIFLPAATCISITLARFVPKGFDGFERTHVFVVYM